MPPQRDWIDPAGVPVRIIGNHVPARFRDHAFAAGVASYIATHSRRLDLVYFLMQGLHLATGLLAAKAFNVPAVMKFSGSQIITTMRASSLGRLELKWLHQWARSIMVLNDGMVQEAVEAGFRREHLVWMPNPVDVDVFAPLSEEARALLRDRLAIPRSAQVAIFVGRLAPEKRLPSLVRGFARAVAKFPEVVLVLVGDGPQRGELEMLVRELGLGANVRFTGRIETADVPLWLQASDIFTLVSELEGFPCSLVEAMSVALPSLVSEIPANRQLIETGINGLTAPVGNVEAIGAALQNLIGDPEFCKRAGAAARRKVVENFSVSKVMGRYEALFDSATLRERHRQGS